MCVVLGGYVWWKQGAGGRGGAEGREARGGRTPSLGSRATRKRERCSRPPEKEPAAPCCLFACVRLRVPRYGGP